MSRDFGIFMPKHLAGYYLLNSYIFIILILPVVWSSGQLCPYMFQKNNAKIEKAAPTFSVSTASFSDTGLFRTLTILSYKTLPTRYTTNAATQAITHCPITTPTAHLLPSSLLMDAIAATHGVYKRQNTSRLAADTGVLRQ